MTYNEICKKAIEKWGVPLQLDMVIEEMAELIQAINKSKRGRESLDQVLEEIVDVEIMLGQLKEIVSQITHGPIDGILEYIRDKKLKRLEERLSL